MKVGDVYDQLTIIEKLLSTIVRNKTGKLQYRKNVRYKCSCGTIGVKTENTIRNHKRKNIINACPTCGYKSRKQSTRRCSNIERLFRLSVISRCKQTKGRIINKLSVTDFEYLVSQNCYYCGAKPKIKKYIGTRKLIPSEELKANGIDRLNNDGHYEVENVVPCCKQCNIMKSTYNYDKFINKIEQILKTQKDK